MSDDSITREQLAIQYRKAALRELYWRAITSQSMCKIFSNKAVVHDVSQGDKFGYLSQHEADYAARAKKIAEAFSKKAGIEKSSSRYFSRYWQA